MENLWVFDIETLKGMFLLCAQNVKTKETVSFEISKRKNEVYAMIKFLKDSNIDFLIGYNNVNFDMQVIEFIIRNHQKWIHLTNEDICKLIHKNAQDVIEDSNYGIFPPFREEAMSIKQIDLFRIHHFDNENKRTSLKWLEFMMDMDNIEDMPYTHMHEDFTEEQYQEVIDYCWNDIEATEKFYYYTTGEVPHEQYRGKNKIQDRLDIINTYQFHPKLMNYSDVKIGDELNKQRYCTLSNIPEQKLYDIRKSRKPTRKFTFGNCIPDYVQFKTEPFKLFYQKVANTRVNLLDATQEFDFEFNGTKYKIARGGIHSVERNRIIICKPGWLLKDADVGSQYPNALRKRELYPSHLGPNWIINYTETIALRLKYKDLAEDKSLDEETRRKYKGLSEMLKLSLNGGGFGKTNERTNWQYDPFVQFSCTIGNQFEILMLIEMMEMSDIHVVSANTDGIVCYFEEHKLPRYYEICKEWEQVVGNTEMGKLEFTDFQKLWQESVNHYIAIKTNGKVKIKGRFLVDDLLNKNNTDKIGRIERRAIQEYVIKGTPVEETIRASRNIKEFCIGMKSTRKYHYETSKPGSKKNTVHKKLIRFYICTDGEVLLKMKNEEGDSKGTKRMKIADGHLVRMFNRYEEKPWEDYKIDYDYYIENANRVIERVEKNRKKDLPPPNKDQLLLF